MAAYPADRDEAPTAQTDPIQEKFDVDGSSVQEPLASAFVEGSVDVTQKDFENLRHVPDSLPPSSFLVVTVEFAERFSYHG